MWVLICMVHLTVCSYDVNVTYACQSESTLYSLDLAPVLSKEFLDIQATIECGFILKGIRGMIKTHSQMHCTDKYLQHSSVIWPAWLNSWVFVYAPSGCGFESSCCHLIFRLPAFFEQSVPWNSGNYSVWIHSERRTFLSIN